jgi:hypothetical protein
LSITLAIAFNSSQGSTADVRWRAPRSSLFGVLTLHYRLLSAAGSPSSINFTHCTHSALRQWLLIRFQTF